MAIGRTVKRVLAAIIILIFYFTIFIPLAPQFISLIESFVQQNSDLFKINIPVTTFSYNETSGNITKTQEVKIIDLSLIVVWLIYFLVYVAIPFGVILTIFSRR